MLLQRKYEFMTIQRLKGNPQATHEAKSLKQEKVPAPKPCKVWLKISLLQSQDIFLFVLFFLNLSKNLFSMEIFTIIISL